MYETSSPTATKNTAYDKVNVAQTLSNGVKYICAEKTSYYLEIYA